MGRVRLPRAGRIRFGASIPADFEPQVIGDRAYVTEQIKQVVSNVDASDPSWVLVDGNDFSIEISLSGEQINGLSFFCRGSGEAVIGVLWAIAQTLSLRIVDLQSGDFLEPSHKRKRALPVGAIIVIRSSATNLEAIEQQRPGFCDRRTDLPCPLRIRSAIVVRGCATPFPP